jgi:hypothetical protein
MDTEPTQPTNTDAEAARSVPGDPSIRVASAEPRIFGAVPPAVALLVGFAAVVCAVVLIGSGSALAGVIMLVSGAILVALAIDAARRWPTSALPRISVRVADAVGSRLGLARVSTAAWGGAAREMVAMKRELRALRSERDEQQSALGAAAYREDDPEVESLRQRIAELDTQIQRCEGAIDDAVGRARERVRRKRYAVQPTQAFAVAEEPSPTEEAARTSETVPRPVRQSLDTQSTDS